MPLASARVTELAGVAEVDLCDYAGRGDDGNRDILIAAVGAAEALDLGIAAGVARLAQARAVADGTRTARGPMSFVSSARTS